MFQSFRRDTLQSIHDYSKTGGSMFILSKIQKCITILSSHELKDDTIYIIEYKDKFYKISCNTNYGFQYHPINNLCPEVVAKQKTEYILKDEKED